VTRDFYANITLNGPSRDDVATYLKSQGAAAFVSPPVRGAIVVFHEDLGGQEDLACRLSAEFSCPALLVMTYGIAVLLYPL
jgi:hypothetical protein